jgi:hypothetical protein
MSSSRSNNSDESSYDEINKIIDSYAESSNESRDDEASSSAQDTRQTGTEGGKGTSSTSSGSKRSGFRSQAELETSVGGSVDSLRDIRTPETSAASTQYTDRDSRGAEETTGEATAYTWKDPDESEKYYISLNRPGSSRNDNGTR